MKRIINTILSLTFCLLLQAQVPQSPTNLQSPNAASLGLYGEVPVSLFTGIPEISIPIFTAPDKYNGFSIGLSYHGGGVRPDQHPGWVGTNWTLMAGGCISRVEKGGCDEIVNDYYLGYYSNSNTLDDNDLTKNNYLYYDTEPDEFIFSFGNYSGKFYFDRNKKLVVKCNKTITVELLSGSFTVPDELKKGRPTSWIYTFKGFSIKTEDGTEYVFGGDQSKLEFNMEFWMQLTNQWYATAWYLAQIKYPNGKTIDFNYERGSMINQMYVSKSSGTYNLYEKNTNGIASETLKCSGTYESGAGDDKYEGYLISPIYLTSISSSDFRIDFQTGYSYELRVSNSIYNAKIDLERQKLQPNGCSNYCNFLPYFGNLQSGTTADLIQSGLSWKYLTSIKIYNNTQSTSTNSPLIKEFTLNYDFSNISSGGDPQYNANERLFLLSVTQNDGGKYNFEYYNKQLLPPYLAEKTDHWGFYNNKLAQYNRNDYFTSREPDAEAMKYGSLKKITYPTGGNTEFEFEANQYSSQTKLNRWEGLDNYSSNKIAGGLRIKKIITTPFFGQTPIVKEYFYTKNYSPTQTNGLSSGILGGHIQYYFDNRSANADKNVGFGSVDGYYSYSCFTSQSVLPVCNNSLGNFIGYSEVVEKLSDGSFTRYKYSNFDTGNLDEIGIASIQTESPYQPYNSKEQERGNLLAKEVYDKNNVIKSSLSNKYKKSDSDYINNIRGNSQFQKCQGELTGTYYTEATSYKVYTYSMLLDSTKTSNYDNNGNPTLADSVEYGYNGYNQLISKTSRTSDGRILTNKTFYPYEIKNGILPTIQVKDYTTFANTVIAANCLNPVIATESYINNKFVKGVYNDYQLLSSTQPMPLLNSVYISNSDATYRNVYSCSSFDLFGNPLATTENNGATSTSYTWGYNYLYPTLINKNNGQIYTYTFKPLVGMTSSTDPRNVTTSYNYDSNNRLISIVDKDNSILSKYKYMYKGGTVTITSDTYIPYNTSKTATATLLNNYNLCNYLYEWTLKTASGNIIASSSTQGNGLTNTFSYTPNVEGTLTLECKVTEVNSKDYVSDSKTIICYKPLSSVSISTNSSVCANTTNVATANVVGGSGNFTYDWRLYTTPTNTIASTSGTNSNFNYTPTAAGLYTLECKVTDNITGITQTVTSNISAQKIISVTNNFVDIASTATINGTAFDVNLIIYSTCALTVGATYCIGASSCIKPATKQTKTITYNNQTWNISFDVNGNLLLMITSGSSYPAYQTINLGTISFSLQ
jgi:YD repeat-containing protein